MYIQLNQIGPLIFLGYLNMCLAFEVSRVMCICFHTVEPKCLLAKKLTVHLKIPSDEKLLWSQKNEEDSLH